MATQIDFHPSTSMQENPPSAKKRKRNNASEDLTPPKRSNLQEVNGNGLSTGEASLPDATTFPDPSNASNYPPHPNPQHDEPTNNMLAALHGYSSNNNQVEQNTFEMGSPNHAAPQPYMSAYTAHASPPGAQGLGGQDNSGLRKPEVGTDEWHKVRRDNHKEVERRRRETINEGINELAKIVPGNEKNKGSILARTVTEIRDLRARVEDYERAGGLSHNVLEQAVHELSSANDSLKISVRSLEAEREQLKAANTRLIQKLRDLGGTVDGEDDFTKTEA